MRLPRTVQPIQRNTAAGAAAQPPGIQPAQVTPSQCVCERTRKGKYFVPVESPNPCGGGNVPQCDTSGRCNCVQRAAQNGGRNYQYGQLRAGWEYNDTNTHDYANWF